MAGKRGSWKNELASVDRSTSRRPRSNKYSRSDTTRERRPAPGARDRIWVGGYTRADGTRVEGYYRATA